MRTLQEFPPPTPLGTPCRLWQGATSSGYGTMYRRGPRAVHRWVWEQINGPIPSGMVVMHRCDQRLCFRYDHLMLGTPSDNTQDMLTKGRWRGGRPIGSIPPNKRVTDEQVVAIKALRGVKSSREVGHQFGISASHIRNIWRKP